MKAAKKASAKKRFQLPFCPFLVSCGSAPLRCGPPRSGGAVDCGVGDDPAECQAFALNTFVILIAVYGSVLRFPAKVLGIQVITVTVMLTACSLTVSGTRSQSPAYQALTPAARKVLAVIEGKVADGGGCVCRGTMRGSGTPVCGGSAPAPLRCRSSVAARG